MSITINVTPTTGGSFTASGVDAPSVNLTVSGGIGPSIITRGTPLFASLPAVAAPPAAVPGMLAVVTYNVW